MNREGGASTLYCIEFEMVENLLEYEKPLIKIRFHHHKEEKPRTELMGFDQARQFASNLEGYLAALQRQNEMARRLR